MRTKRDYYEVLGVNRGAVEAQIDEAYHQRLNEIRSAGGPQTLDRLLEANRAHRVLSNRGMRAHYDKFGPEDGHGSPKRDFYEVLGVARTASAEEIKSARERLVSEIRTAGGGLVFDRLLEVNRAYSILNDPAKRRRFDERGEESTPDLFLGPRDGHADAEENKSWWELGQTGIEISDLIFSLFSS